MAKKIRVGIIFGGRSTEHEVSLRSARSVIAALDTKKYEPVLIGIDKSGKWLPIDTSTKLLANTKPTPASTKVVVPEFSNEMRKSLDVVFPVMHGSFGEDGTMQGFLKLAGVPFVGPSVLGSAVGMDKDVTKRLLRDAGIGIAPFLVYRKHERAEMSFAFAKKKLGLPMFVKPANAGSSVGVSKVKNEQDFNKAVDLAFEFDTKILIEKGIKAREIECAVLGNEFPEASVLGEVIPGEEFYSYDDKYASTSASKTQIPAELPKPLAKKIREIAVKAYKILELEGLTRVDFFVTDKGEIMINEVNTIPGFTSISMYPKMWEASGLSYSALLDKLITLAIARYNREKALRTSM